MAETPKSDNAATGNGAAAAAAGEQAFQARVVSQYTKDLSFENPNVERLIEGPLKEPRMEVEVNVNARRMRDDLFETLVELNAKASSEDRAIYQLEVVYGGMFQVKNLPAEAKEAFLLVHCPSILFPFLRRIVADVTRDGGFEPLMLDPIDFGQLYLQRRQQGGSGPA